MKLKSLQRNIIQGIGIFLFSVTILYPLNGWGFQGEKQNRPPPINPGSRKFEIQFHSVNINGKLWYRYLHQMGIDNVIVRVFQDQEDSGGLFFTNSIFRVIHPFLDRLIDEFKSEPLNLYAWMITRRFNWVRDTDCFDYVYENGRRYQVKKFDIFNPDAINKIISVYGELAAKKIKGILLQDDFFLRYNEGFSNWGKAVFTHKTKFPANEKLMINSKSISNQYWRQVKIDQIIRVLEMIVKKCKSVNPEIKIGMNIHYETPYYRQKSKSWYAHDLTRLVKTGIDYVYLMSYHRQMKRELKLTEQQNRNLFKKIVDEALRICGSKLVVKLQIRDWKTSKLISLSELTTYLGLIPDGVNRICLTPVKTRDFGYIEQIIQAQDRKILSHRGH
ncbi:MAG: hypothetical protein KAT17_08805 [Candidatus Aminicenantes bacterium]|nr:hypothetical protein [Candidatus Aminicenantes bacterium]